MTVAIIDYGSGNLRSAAKAFESLTNESIVVTNDAAVVARADRIVLPGVGSFADAREVGAGTGGAAANEMALLAQGRATRVEDGFATVGIAASKGDAHRIGQGYGSTPCCRHFGDFEGDGGIEATD